MNEDDKKEIIELAKSLTEDVYLRRLERLRKRNDKWADYLDERKEEFVAYCFLDKGIRRWGKVTSNSTETINGVLNEARTLPIVYLLEHILQYQRQKFHDRHEQAKKWSDEGRLATEYLRQLQHGIADDASRKKVDIFYSEPPIYKGRVQVSTMAPLTGVVEVTINTEERLGYCPCRYQDEMGVNCSHTKALLLALNKASSWCSPRYHVTTYMDCYSADIPAMAMAGKLSTDETFIPPEYKKPAGRPTKKRKERPWLRKTSVRRLCTSCGSPGHFHSTCTTPSTEYRYNHHKQKAIAWCKKVENAQLP
jgi:hypothetical protein